MDSNQTIKKLCLDETVTANRQHGLMNISLQYLHCDYFKSLPLQY